MAKGTKDEQDEKTHARRHRNRLVCYQYLGWKPRADKIAQECSNFQLAKATPPLRRPTGHNSHHHGDDKKQMHVNNSIDDQAVRDAVVHDLLGEEDWMGMGSKTDIDSTIQESRGECQCSKHEGQQSRHGIIKIGRREVKQPDEQTEEDEP